jgi:protein-S-isoprenylcysteine O-methyltransferase Ste14
LYITCRVEENEMIARFGDEYRQYMTRSKMFIPFIL